jgi:hypothetical protein
MSGLLSGVLPYVYSRSNWLQRQVNGLLSNPAGMMEQSAGLLGDNLQAQIALQNQAFADKNNPFKVSDKKAFNQLVDSTFNGLLSFAPGTTYYRNTRGPSPDNGVGYMMFADSPERISSYGKNRWRFDDANLPARDLLDATTKSGQREIARALLKDRQLLREYGAHPKQLASEANPRNIVDSAGLWDNPQIVESLWKNLLDEKGYRAIRTNDGAVVLDKSLVNRASP